MTERIVTDANGRKYITTEPLPAKIIDYEAAYYALQKKIGFDKAELWIQRINKAVAEEREACAKVVEADPSYDWHKFACEAAAAIRARGNT
jgi:hypothetical protein